MRDKIRVIGVSLVALAGLLLVSGVAWAQASKTSVSGEVLSRRITDLGETWLDEEGVFQVRNQKRTVRLSGDIDGRMFRVMDIAEDTITGEVRVHGFFSFVGEVLGDLVTATGHAKGKCNPIEGRLICENNEVWHLSDGGLMKTSRIREAGTFPYAIVGVIYDNPGGR